MVAVVEGGREVRDGRLVARHAVDAARGQATPLYRLAARHHHPRHAGLRGALGGGRNYSYLFVTPL